jgi:hypothetical protein
VGIRRLAPQPGDHHLEVTEFLESGRIAAAFSGGLASAEPGFPVEQLTCDLQVA